MRMPQPATGPAASASTAADSTDGARAPGSGGLSRRTVTTLIRATPGVLRRHWLASVLITAGIVLRLLTELAYHPAIVYIDSLKYLYGAWPGSDPVAYKVPIKLITGVGGGLGTIELVQHLLGVAIAVALYMLLIRRGIPKWLGALAIAPILLDAYQLQVEAMIMPDIWFEAFIAAGLIVLLWKPVPSLPVLMIAGAIFGASVGFRQVGEVLIVPAVIYVAALRGGWRKVVQRASAVTIAFVIAVLFYLSASYQLTGHFWISRSSVSLTYGRMAAVADCTTLTLPPIERSLCPSRKQQSYGPDWLDHSINSPLRTYASALPANRDQLVVNFNRSVERQQPLRVVAGILRDSVKLFALTRHTSPGDTPIWRWQFQTSFPSYQPWVKVDNNKIWVTLGTLQLNSVEQLKTSYGGSPQVDKPIASFLRGYQLNGGYTPGPLFAICLIAGLIGSVLALTRRRLGRNPAARDLAIACLAFFATGALVLGVSDVFEFTWRYQLPALVTLPPAGALGIGVLILAARKSREPVAADAVSERAPEMAAPAP